MTYLQILKLNEVRKGIGKASGNPYEMQDAECLILTDAGEVQSVGVLMIPKPLMGKVSLGTFAGTFEMRPNMRDRKIEAVLVGVVQVRKSGTGFVPVEPAKAV